jgi:hypothetical protein
MERAPPKKERRSSPIRWWVAPVTSFIDLMDCPTDRPPITGKATGARLSRTNKGSKSPGYEYWSRRPFNKFGGAIGKFAKRRTHKAERREHE